MAKYVKICQFHVDSDLSAVRSVWCKCGVEVQVLRDRGVGVQVWRDGGVEVQPVAGDVDGHGQLEEEHKGGVESGQGSQQAHGSAPVSQHV